MTAEAGPRGAGEIVTFYSYKGGVGRTMALVNVGWIMAGNGLRVLLVDWDLEAPGLHRYLRPFLVDPELRGTDGLINMVQAYAARVTGPAGTVEAPSNGSGATVMTDGELRACARLGPYTTGLDLDFPAGGRLDILPAGRQTASYSAAVTTFRWDVFYERLGGGSFLQVLREEMKASYDYVLIDSRTGVTDISSICTLLMPDVLVDGFALNIQGIQGGAGVAASVAGSTGRTIRILPVPLRVQSDQRERLEAGRASAQTRFEPYLGWLDERQHERYWSEVEIPYRSYYAYEEIPATVGDDPSFREGSLLGAFERLTGWITDGRVRTLPPLPPEKRSRYRDAYLYRPRALPPLFHVSYAPVDRMWAEWAAGHLEETGYQVSLRPLAEHGGGGDAPAGADVAPERRGRLLALLSPEYTARPGAEAIRSHLGTRETDDGPALVEVRVREPESPGAGPVDDRPVTDLTRCSPAEAAARLRAAVGPPSAGRAGPPGTGEPAGTRPAPHPAASPAVRRIPSRNVSFTGREFLLEELRDRFTSGVSPLPQVLCGPGGMGKTQIAQEYAHRFQAAYDVVLWVEAEQPGLILPALAELAPGLGLESGADVAGTADAVLRALRRGEPYDRWLLVYDNAGAPEELTDLLPGGPPGGHVLLTSRDRAWTNSANVVDVELFRRRESTELLHRLNPGLSGRDADRVAEELGDLPLAVAQAAVWLGESGMPVDAYLTLLKERHTDVLSDTRLPEHEYPRSAAATWLLTLDDLNRTRPAAARMLEICSSFGPDPIPVRLLYAPVVHEALHPPAGQPRDALALADVMRAVNRSGLARSDQSSATVTMHRLVRAVIREQIDDTRAPEVSAAVHSALADAGPGDPDAPADWDRYAELLPHLRPSGATGSATPAVRSWVTDSVRYLWKRSLHRAARDLAEEILTDWTGAGIGSPDDPETLRLRTQLGNVVRSQGELPLAYEIDQDTFERFRRTRGPRDPLTLAAAGSVGADLRALGRYEEARTLDRTTLAAAREALGESHQRTMMYTNNLAMSEYLVGDRRAAAELHRHAYRVVRDTQGANSLYALLFAANYARDLRETGRLGEALTLLRDTVRRYDETLGEHHTDTLQARKNLAVALRRNGEHAQAMEIDEGVHARYVEAYGPDHPEVLAVACNLAGDLAALGRPEPARQLAERARARYEASLGPHHPVTLACASNLSVHWRRLGREDEARELSHHAHRELARVVGESHPYTLSCAVNHANDLFLQGRPQDAAAWERRTRRHCVGVLGAEHHDTIAVTSNLALSLRATGHEAEAEQLTGEALSYAEETLGRTHPTYGAVRDGERLDSDIEPPTT
jgi:tetratricopeptide (TPR) repeat protein